MHPALGIANQRLYHASILTRLLVSERERQELPVSVLMAAVGEAARWHLQGAYGWFLVALAELPDMPANPPLSVAELVVQQGLEEPLRGELVELRQLEASGWLHVLLAGGGGASRTGSTADSGLALVARDWDEVQLVRWHDEIADLIDRMSHSLEEW